MKFFATKARVSNRGVPPDEFLTELVEWGRSEFDSIFEANPNPADIYALISHELGPWQNLLHRRAAMLEAARVHAGLESSWKFNEGKDPGNPNPDPKSWETGLFQVSFDSTEIHSSAMRPYAIAKGIGTVGSFISQMKTDHKLAFEYYARLVRISIAWAGPLKRHEVNPWLSRASVTEFESLLT